jgi:hypothetical protein
MKTENFFPLTVLSNHYNIELSFFFHLSEIGLIEIKMIEEAPHIDEQRINEVEKIIRLYNELELNIEGIDVVLNLLQKIETIQTELTATKNRLRLFE